MVEDLSLDQGNLELPPKNKQKSKQFCFDCVSDPSSFWKTATLGSGGGGGKLGGLVYNRVEKFTGTIVYLV